MPAQSKIQPLKRTEREYEEAIQNALDAVMESGLRPSGNPKYSLRQAALDFDVSRSTLTARWNGRPSRAEVDREAQLLTPEQEELLVQWMIELGHRGMGWSPDAIMYAATQISGHQCGEKWLRLFRARHLEIKFHWTTALERCRASSLNRTQVTQFFDLITKVFNQLKITANCIYNVDEKGIQLGVGGRSGVLVGASQKTAYQVENGDREMVTSMECICADGTSVPPMLIYKSATRDLEWGQDNPLGAVIGHSPNGWTDQELGCLWLEKAFVPHITAKHGEGVPVVLILDGHNSHTTYKFVTLAKKYSIEIIILPSHTTHRLQPCDVAVFAPLALFWKIVVNNASHEGIHINKRTLPRLYAKAREAAFKPQTLKSAFQKTGIWPLNPNIVEDEAYAPSKNTSTEMSMPVLVSLPSLLVPIPSPAMPMSQTATEPVNTSSAGGVTTTPHLEIQPDVPAGTNPNAIESNTTPSLKTSTNHSNTVVVLEEPSRFRLAGLVPPSRQNATREAVIQENQLLRHLLKRATIQLEQDHAHKTLMEEENKRLRQELYGKKERATQKRAPGEGEAWLLTSDEQLDALALYDWKRNMETLLHDHTTKEVFKQQRQIIKDDEHAREEIRTTARIEASRARAAQKRERELKIALDRARKAEEKQLEQLANKERQELLKLANKAKKAEEREQKAKAKAEERERQKMDKEAKKALGGPVRKTQKLREALTDKLAQVNSTACEGRGNDGQANLDCASSHTPEACMDEQLDNQPRRSSRRRPVPSSE